LCCEHAGILSVLPRQKPDYVRHFFLLRFIFPEKRHDAKRLLLLNQAGQVVAQELAQLSFFIATFVLLLIESPNLRLTAG